jgi:hypothetical protein
MSALATTTNRTAEWSQPQVQLPSLGWSALSTTLSDRLRGMYIPPPSSASLQSSMPEEVLAGNKKLRLFNVAAALKIAVSQVSMHLPADWRHLLFEKIDTLHEPDDWDESDHLADIESFKTFLRTVLQQGPMKRMSLGISDDGHILAGWKLGQDSLALKFLTGDEIRWSVVRHLDGAVESAAGQTTLSRLPLVLQPYSPECWFGNADKTSST